MKNNQQLKSIFFFSSFVINPFNSTPDIDMSDSSDRGTSSHFFQCIMHCTLYKFMIMKCFLTVLDDYQYYPEDLSVVVVVHFLVLIIMYPIVVRCIYQHLLLYAASVLFICVIIFYNIITYYYFFFFIFFVLRCHQFNTADYCC